MSKRTQRRDSAISIMARLIGLVGSMVPVMLLAILLGVLGFLCAIFLTVFAAYGVVYGAAALVGEGQLAMLGITPFTEFLVNDTFYYFIVLAALAVGRGVLHYGEQYCNHYIAFRILAIIRHKVFVKLRELAPAKLDGRDKGDLISLITSDIELLEVFYAHTISPIAIAVIVSAVMVAFVWSQNMVAGVIALVAYLVIGVIVPIWNGRRSGDLGLDLRDEVGDLNAFVLDSLYGLDETIQYDGGRRRARQLDNRSQALAGLSGLINRVQQSQVALTNLLIQLFSWGVLLAMLWLFVQGEVTFSQMLVATVAVMGSFGPVSALSNLSTTLSGTLAAGQRVLDLMSERPAVEDLADCDPLPSVTLSGARSAESKDPREAPDGRRLPTSGSPLAAELDAVEFAYGDDPVLDDFSLRVPAGSIVGVHGPSGSGKSTALKLLMRFWDPDRGTVRLSGRDVRKVNTDDLRGMESYVEQETWLFHESIADNIALARPDARRSEVIEAARRASLHEFVKTLPDGYDTNVGELGDNLSDGERQRIGLARAFLHDAPIMLLDEPTSNLDSLNEAVILRSLEEASADKTIVLVSHRASTMSLATETVTLDSSKRASS